MSKHSQRSKFASTVLDTLSIIGVIVLLTICTPVVLVLSPFILLYYVYISKSFCPNLSQIYGLAHLTPKVFKPEDYYEEPLDIFVDVDTYSAAPTWIDMSEYKDEDEMSENEHCREIYRSISVDDYHKEISLCESN